MVKNPKRKGKGLLWQRIFQRVTGKYITPDLHRSIGSADY